MMRAGVCSGEGTAGWFSGATAATRSSNSAGMGSCARPGGPAKALRGGNGLSAASCKVRCHKRARSAWAKRRYSSGSVVLLRQSRSVRPSGSTVALLSWSKGTRPLTVRLAGSCSTSAREKQNSRWLWDMSQAAPSSEWCTRSSRSSGPVLDAEAPASPSSAAKCIVRSWRSADSSSGSGAVEGSPCVGVSLSRAVTVTVPSWEECTASTGGSAVPTGASCGGGEPTSVSLSRRTPISTPPPPSSVSRRISS